MAKIVINMPDYMLNQIMIGYPFKLPSQFVAETYKIIRNGKILPKGHGRLIDEGVLKNQFPIWVDNFSSYGVNKTISKTPTVIEADKEEV